MINRSTFYQHFTDKYAVLESLQEKYVTEMTETVKVIQQKEEIALVQIDSIIESYFVQN